MTQPTLAPTHRAKNARIRKVVAKPEKPWADFPLYWHPRGYWMCRRGGEDWIYGADAIKSYNQYVIDEKSRREGASRAAPVRRYLLRDAVNAYLGRQKRRHADGEISDVQLARCRAEMEYHLPKAVSFNTPLTAFRAAGPDDMGPSLLFRSIRTKAVSRGLDAAHKHIVILRACLDYAKDRKLMLSPDYGDEFNPPSQSAIEKRRRQRDQEQGERAWTIEELRHMLAEARKLAAARKTKEGKDADPLNPHLYAQILLGLFGGFGSDDLSIMRESELRRDLGVVRHNRAKVGKPCVCALAQAVWDAIDQSIAARANPADAASAGLLFLTQGGRRCNLAKNQEDAHGLRRAGRNDTIGKNFQRFCKRIGLHKPRAGFKTLRAMCRTMLVGAGVDEDIRAAIMGRKLRYAADEFYLRGDLRSELFKAARHIESQLFPTKRTAPRRPKAKRTGGKKASARAASARHPS